MEKKIAKKYIDEEIEVLKRADSGARTLASVSRNLNKLALNNELAPVFSREKEVEDICKLLLRRTKPNAMLIGVAGCGKTAIVEALAIHIANQKVKYLNDCAAADRKYEKSLSSFEPESGMEPPAKIEVPKPPLCDMIIYDLSMNSLVAGTKYRGEFEDKLNNVISECRRNPNIVLFIDEIHQMNTIGAAEGCSSMGQILKPALARAEIRVIGATTIEESAILKKDKALSRRFSDCNIAPLSGAAAVSTAELILSDYEKFHGVIVNNMTGENILEMVNYYIGGVFPNNFIDVVDEAMSGAKFDGKAVIGIDEIKETISRLSGKVIM